MYIMVDEKLYYRIAADENKLVVSNKNNNRRGKTLVVIKSSGDTLDDYHEVWDEDHAKLYGTEIIGEEKNIENPEKILKEKQMLEDYKFKSKMIVQDRFLKDLNNTTIEIGESQIRENETFEKLKGKYTFNTAFASYFQLKYLLFKSDLYLFGRATGDERYFEWFDDECKVHYMLQDEIDLFVSEYIKKNEESYKVFVKRISEIDAAQNMEDLHKLGYFVGEEIVIEDDETESGTVE